MFIALTAFLVIFSLFLHELGHALYMKKYGVPIETFSIGLPFPIALRFRSKKFLNGALIQFTPLLLGAYVKSTSYKGEDPTALLSYKEQADIYGAGPLANFIFGLSILLALGTWTNWENTSAYLLNYRTLLMLAFLITFSIAPKWFSRYLMLPLGVSMMVLTVWLIFQDPGKSVSGPVGIAKIMGEASGVYTSLLISSFLSVSIGLFNTFPLLPLDGGRTMNALIGRYPNLQAAYQLISAVILLMLFSFAILSDFIK